MATTDQMGPSPIVTASGIKNGVSSITSPPTPVDNTPYDIISNSVTNSIIGDYSKLNDQQNKAQQDQQKSGTDILSIMNQLSGKTADTQAANENAGVNAETQNLNNYVSQLADLNAQASALNREAQAIPIQVQQESQGLGRTDRGVAPITTARLRENALKALSIGQQADIAHAAATGSQLKLQAAKDKAQQMVDLKYKPIEDALAVEKQRYDLNKDNLSAIDKKRTEALGIALKKEEQDMADKKAKEKAVSDLIINASPVAPPDVIRNAKSLQEKGASPLEVAISLGKYGGDYLKNELLKTQLKTEVAQQANYYANIAKTKAETAKIKTETSQLTSPGANLKPLTEGQAKDLTYAQRGTQAEVALSNLEKTVAGMSGFKYTAEKALEGNNLTNSKASPEIKQYSQAQRNFLAAVLRRESGAQISDSEFAMGEKQYFVRPGDDAKTIALKKQNRETAINSFKQNIPGYDQRTVTPEDSYLNTIDSSLGAVAQKTDPVNLYIMQLQGLKTIGK